MQTTLRRVSLVPRVIAVILCAPAAHLHAQGGGSVFELVAVEGELSLGVEVTGALSSSDTRAPDDAFLEAWTIEGAPGESVTIDLIADDFDPYLYVAGPGFDGTLRDDDSGGACYARISMTFLERGTFRVVASSNGPRATGTYTLRVSDTPGPTAGYACGGMNPAILLDLPVGGRTLMLDGEVAGALAADNPTIGTDGKKAEAWHLEGREGESVTVTLSSEDFDSYLYVVGPGLGEVLYDDDGAGNLDSRITFTFPTDDTYTVVASSLSPGEGSYTIRVEEAVGMNELPTEDRVVEVGGTVSGWLTESDPIVDDGRYGQAWALAGSAGEVYTIDLMSDEFDSYLYFTGPGFLNPESNDDGGDGLNSRLTLTLPEDGMYRIIVSSLSTSSLGEFTLRVMAQER